MLEAPRKRCDAHFKASVLSSCYEALSDAGFTRYRKEDVDWPLSKDFHCWVGLNSNLDDEFFQINPFVGVHVVPIMKLYTSLEGRKYDRSIATHGVHFGEITPKERLFRFTRDTDVASEAKRLANLYSTAGLSYASSIASYDRLLPLLQDRVDQLGAYPERVASCLYLMDRKEDARAFVQDFLSKHRDYFEAFALPFLKLLSH